MFIHRRMVRSPRVAVLHPARRVCAVIDICNQQYVDYVHIYIYIDIDTHNAGIRANTPECKACLSRSVHGMDLHSVGALDARLRRHLQHCADEGGRDGGLGCPGHPRQGDGVLDPKETGCVCVCVEPTIGRLCDFSGLKLSYV